MFWYVVSSTLAAFPISLCRNPDARTNAWIRFRKHKFACFTAAWSRSLYILFRDWQTRLWAIQAEGPAVTEAPKWPCYKRPRTRNWSIQSGSKYRNLGDLQTRFKQQRGTSKVGLAFCRNLLAQAACLKLIYHCFLLNVDTWLSMGVLQALETSRHTTDSKDSNKFEIII